jgi:gamma-glutamyltranspeptidase/glutathione hydrolase
MNKRVKMTVFLGMFLFCFVHAADYHCSHGAVVSHSSIASGVGLEVLRDGGNAFDAAVATGFALAVTYPSAGNLGGGGFAVIRTQDGGTYSLDFRELSPKALTSEHFLTEQGEVDHTKLTLHPLGCGVPGTVAGLIELHRKYGSMNLKKLIQPAIVLAQKGFPLSASRVQSYAGQMRFMAPYPASREIFSTEGKPFSPGHIWIQKDLAQTLKRICDKGKSGFYEGRTAELIVAEMKRTGGVMTLEDLKNYRPVWREPIRGTYQKFDIVSMPPPSSGGILLVQILNMIEALLVNGLDWHDSMRIHCIVEAERLAYADRAFYLGDPDFNVNPVRKLVSKAYAYERIRLIQPYQASDSDKTGHGEWPHESPETTHFSVLDGKGNAVSITTTLNWAYGNKRVVPGAGFLMNNEVDDFSVLEGVPNTYGLLGSKMNLVEGGKRMLSSMSPTIVTGPDGFLLVLGAPGGSTIITTVLQVILNVVDHGMDLGMAVRAPRIHHQWKPDEIRIERLGWNPDMVRQLKSMGHRNIIKYMHPIGDVNAVLLRNGEMEAVTDPRFDALPAVY